MSDESLDRMFKRAEALRIDGLDMNSVFALAWLEERVHRWPTGYGDDLVVIIYGDFQAPTSDLAYPSIGITVHCEKVKESIVRTAQTVLKATVKVKEKSVPAIIDATRRINLLLGVWTLFEWGNAGVGWWSWVTHDNGGGSWPPLAYDGIEPAIESILQLQPQVRRKVDGALYWVREPRKLLMEGYRRDTLRMFSSYWNAFECLVDAVGICKPASSLNKGDKQVQIDQFLDQRGRKLTAKDIAECYQKIVNPGFVGKASHALSVCFPNESGQYADECFRLPNKDDRLYNIRNAINHGEIDAENPNELIRVEARLHRLWMIVWRMFRCFIPFPSPAHM